VILLGDCRATLPTLDAGSVRCCVTSPPYWGLRDYGCDGQIGLEKTPDAYVAEIVAVFREVRRVLADDGTLWLNLGDSYAQSGKGGNPVVSEWAGFVGNKDREASAQPRALKALDIGLKPKDLVGIPWRVAFALQADGWYLRSDIIWHKPNPMPESVTDRPTKAHEYVFLLSKNQKYFYDADAIAEAATFAGKVVSLGEKSLSRGQATGANVAASGNGTASSVTVKDTRNARTVWTIPTQPTPDAHFATFPEALAERCILAGSAQGDTVLDPFFGSGTVGKVAERLGRKWIGCELNPAYVGIAEKKTAQKGLFR
jgi:DNA modification methylase